MSIGERLKQARLKKNMTQDELGQALGGLAGPTISAIEKGTAKNFRDPQHIFSAAKTLGVSPIWLQFGLGDEDLIQETIPLINWEDVLKLPVSPEKILRRVPTTVSVSNKSFALKIYGNSMAAPSGSEITFKEGSIVIIDPEAKLKPNSYVITTHNETTLLRKIVQDGSKRYLQPLNHLFQQEQVTDQTQFHGVVRALLLEEFD